MTGDREKGEERNDAESESHLGQHEIELENGNTDRAVGAIAQLRGIEDKRELRHDWVNIIRKLHLSRPEVGYVADFVKEHIGIDDFDVRMLISYVYGDEAKTHPDPLSLMSEAEITFSELFGNDEPQKRQLRAPAEFNEIAHRHHERLFPLLHDVAGNKLEFELPSPDDGVAVRRFRRRIEEINKEISRSLRAAIGEINVDYSILKSEGGKCCALYFKIDPEDENPDVKMNVQIQREFLSSRNNVGVLTQLLIRPNLGRVDWETKPLGNFWFGHPDRRTYEGLMFDPDNNEPVISNHINVWRGFAVEPRPGKWELMREHIRKVLADGDAASDEYITRWLAWSVQNPGRVAETALCFVGDQGTGKTTAGRWLLKIFGIHGTRPTSARQITGNFNYQLRDKVFCLNDEALNPENSTAAGILKGLISDDKLMFEAKGRDAVVARNRLKMMIVSNNDHFVKVEVGDRRYAVFRVSKAHKQDDPYFQALNAEANQGGIEAMLFELLDMKLGNWHPRRDIPRTRERMNQQALSFDSFDGLLYHLLDSGILPVSTDNDGSHDKTKTDDGISRKVGYFVRTEALLKMAAKEDVAVTSEKISALLRRLNGAAPDGSGLRLFHKFRPTGGERPNGWLFPPLAEARRLWEAAELPSNWEVELDEDGAAMAAEWSRSVEKLF